MRPPRQEPPSLNHAGADRVLTSCSVHIFFFFQAEDGIRDLIVTGVQTCALPISSRVTTPLRVRAPHKLLATRSVTQPQHPTMEPQFSAPAVRTAARTGAQRSPQIGRASCRERV